jgi:phosphoribosylglycinamide formyltransferase 1
MERADKKVTRIAVLVSGNGTNLQAIINAQAGNILGPCEVKLVISDRPGARALERAREAGIPVKVIEKRSDMSREGFDGLLREEIVREKIDLIVLAGFMRVLGEKFVREFKGKIMNIHPALLPCFKGTAAIRDAFDYGVKVTGVTVHFVDEGVDSGPIIAQKEVRIEESDTIEALEEKIHKAEHELYPEAIRAFSEGKLKIEERKVKVISKQT